MMVYRGDSRQMNEDTDEGVLMHERRYHHGAAFLQSSERLARLEVAFMKKFVVSLHGSFISLCLDTS
jgi:hypothetical protein